MTLTHETIETLLAAYAVDAVDLDEAKEIESHLETCPRCRAELARHLEVAALIGNGASEAPAGLWDRIAGQLGEPTPVADPTALIARLPRPTRRTRLIWPLVAAAAVAAVVALGIQVNRLDNQVNNLQAAAGSSSLSSTLSSPHTTVMLTSAAGKGGTVIVAPGGTAYWLSSDLARLPASETYQLWGLVRGKPVSLGLLGSNPGQYSAFKVQSGTRQLMVTVEPEGGTPGPTSAVVLAGTVPQLA